MVNDDKAELISTRKQIIHEDRNLTSSKISDFSRYIGYGTVAATFTILTSTSPFTEKIYSESRVILLSSSAFGCLTILFDYLQYYFGYLASQKAYKNEEYDYQYNKKWFVYRARTSFFWIKQIAAFLSAVLLIFLILMSILI